jgi:hypothetical protein
VPKYGKGYYGEYLTNHGKSKKGHVRVDGQATRRASTIPQRGYCFEHEPEKQNDDNCLFANGTTRPARTAHILLGTVCFTSTTRDIRRRACETLI